MIALDTNLLIYAHRKAAPEHKAAQTVIEKACDNKAGCGIAIFSIAEFWSVVTHPSAGSPSTNIQAAGFLRALLESSGMGVWAAGVDFAARLTKAAERYAVHGTRIFDLQIALVALEQGATEIWTNDRSFIKIPGLKRVHPL